MGVLLAGGVQHEQLLLGSALLHTQGRGQLSGNTAATSDRLLCLSSAGALPPVQG